MGSHCATHDYTLRDIVIQLYDGDHIQADIDLLRREGLESDMDMLEAFLNDVACCEDAMWVLCRRRDEFPHPAFNCRVIECFLRRGYNISRLRPLRGRLSQYRVIYAFNHQTDEITLLAVTRKKPDPMPTGATNDDYYNYQQEHPVTRRVEREYELLRIPVLAG